MSDIAHIVLAYLRWLREDRRQSVTLFMFMALNSVTLSAADPIILKMLIDSMTHGRFRYFIVFSALLPISYAFLHLTGYLAELLLQKEKNNITKNITSNMTRAYFEKHYESIRKHNAGYYLSRVYDEPTQLANGLETIVKLFRSLLMFTSALAVCLWLSWETALVLAIIVPVLLYLSRVFGKKVRKTTNESKETEAFFRARLQRDLASYKNTVLFDLLDRVQENISHALDTCLDKNYDVARHSAAFETSSKTFLSFAELSVMVGAGVQVIRNALTVGGLFAFFGAYWRVVNAFKAIAMIGPDLAILEGILERVEQFSQVTQNPSKYETGSSISLDAVSYSYADRTVLEDVELNIQQGEHVLLLGNNGSGKSTLAHILAGFLTPRSGQMTAPTTSSFSALLSPAVLPSGTLRSHLKHDELALHERQLLQSLLKSLKLSDILDKDIADLSSGQQKKCFILLTLMRRADVYIFDEPLANVDTESRCNIMQTIEKTTRGNILIMILHGANAYQSMFNRVLYLQNGRLARSPSDLAI